MSPVTVRRMTCDERNRDSHHHARFGGVIHSDGSTAKIKEGRRQHVTKDMDLSDLSSPALLDELTLIASRAAAEILRVCQVPLNTRQKSDATPVTIADEAAQAVILDGLSRVLPGTPVVSEESTPPSDSLWPVFVLVDPLDGTRELIAGRDEYTVNIAIVENGMSRAGVVAAPARKTIWRGIVGRGAQRLLVQPGAGPAQAEESIAISARRISPPRVAVASRSHLDPATETFISRFPGMTTTNSGSSVKFALLAEGQADVYPRLSPTCEWDICAGDAVLTAAGGIVTLPDGEPLRYGGADRNFRIDAFVAWGNPDAAVTARVRA